MPIRKILVALDISQRAPRVLETAIELAEATRARLVLFRAVAPPADLSAGLLLTAPDDAMELLVREARQELSSLSKPVPTDLLGGLRVSIGQPWQAICEAARGEDADLIVIGSHGYHFIERVLGTTAAHVVNHADRAVLVVRPTRT